MRGTYILSLVVFLKEESVLVVKEGRSFFLLCLLWFPLLGEARTWRFLLENWLPWRRTWLSARIKEWEDLLVSVKKRKGGRRRKNEENERFTSHFSIYSSWEEFMPSLIFPLIHPLLLSWFPWKWGEGRVRKTTCLLLVPSLNQEGEEVSNLVFSCSLLYFFSSLL